MQESSQPGNSVGQTRQLKSYKEYVKYATHLLHKNNIKKFSDLELNEIVGEIMLADYEQKPPYYALSTIVANSWRVKRAIWNLRKFKAIPFSVLDEEVLNQLSTLIGGHDAQRHRTWRQQDQHFVTELKDLISVKLSEREQKFIHDYYYNRQTLAEIASANNRSIHAVNKTIKKALKKLCT